jgi:pilus assembly protein CpaE
LIPKQISQEKIRVVLNRHQKRGLISDSEIEKAIRKRIFWKVPNQYAHVVKTINGGDPVSQLSSSEVMRNLSEWAAALGKGPDLGQKAKESFGLLKFLNR